MSAFGKFLYHTWHRPRAALQRVSAHGGWSESRRTARGRAAMENAAFALPPLPATSGASIELHLLTGRRFWFQTAFCLWTFARHACRRLSPVIYDDGSLDEEYRDPFRQLFPATRFVDRASATAALEAHLPAARYPQLRERWLNYPNIRKLIDPHLGSSGWKLVIDSDLLFFRRPDLLIAWFDHSRLPLHAVDCENSYGYSRALMDRLAGATTSDRVNVGLVGLKSDDLDWDKIEAWVARLHAAEGTHYYLEQALTAMLLSGRSCTIAPPEDYVTFPRPPETEVPVAVMHHYVAASKREYFRHCWRYAVDTSLCH